MKTEAKRAMESLPDDLKEAVNKIITEESYKTFKIEVKKFKTDGGSYLASLYEINVNGETNKGDKEMNLFVKYIISAENEKLLDISEAYVKESLFYNEIAQVYEKLQDDAKVPHESRLKLIKNYKGTNKQMIIMDNMVKKGYQCYSRKGVMPLKLAELAVQQISRFHGLAYVLKKKRPEYFNRKLKHLRMPYHFNDDFDKFMKQQCETSVKRLDDLYKQKVDDLSKIFLNKFRSHVEDILPGATIAHGDYRVSNMLFKKEEDEITSVVPVDYQLIHYGCPINDFLYLLFTSTDREFRKNHMEDLKTLYYESLRKFLQYFEMDVEDIYTRDEFESQFKEKLDYGLIVGIFVLPFVLCTEGKEPKVGEEDLTNLDFDLDDYAYERIKEMFDEFIEWGYL